MSFFRNSKQNEQKYGCFPPYMYHNTQNRTESQEKKPHTSPRSNIFPIRRVFMTNRAPTRQKFALFFVRFYVFQSHLFFIVSPKRKIVHTKSCGMRAIRKKNAYNPSDILLKMPDFISVYPFSCKKSFRFVTDAFRIVTVWKPPHAQSGDVRDRVPLQIPLRFSPVMRFVLLFRLFPTKKSRT